eukprot:TRINITY_DN5338_c0_g1_i2.p1 TRINITY_DN5338_c0_g1~~TRINITY_DN5338_c0_g1_i2.p1  ORF type:complete len:693 (+),score=113.11 TRINITY_DN5338_c0_g1_i2:103-2181(+)
MTEHKKIVVIGSGISGLSAAYHLLKYDPSVRITLIESEDEIGGHEMPVETVYGTVDMGFMVLNQVTYPNLLRFYEEMNIPIDETDMSFSVEDPDTSFKSFAFGSNAQTARFLMKKDGIVFLKEKKRFHEDSNEYLRFPENATDGITILEWLNQRNYHESFIYGWVVPFCAAVWSSPIDGAGNLEAYTILQFLRNHGFLNWSTIQWYTPSGRTKVTLDRLQQWFSERDVEILTNSKVTEINRSEEGVYVSFNGGTELYDEAVIAASAGVANRIISDKTDIEKEILEGFRTYPNDVILHTDPSMMPSDKRNWTSWNIIKDNGEYVVTYWLKNLQHIDEENLFITLNPSQDWIDRNTSSIVFRKTMYHPLLDKIAVKSQKDIHKIQGSNKIWYAGAYLRYGFHEDGFVSGIEVARGLLKNNAIPLDPVRLGQVSSLHKVLSGKTTHARFRPISRSFEYDLCMDYIDLDTATGVRGYHRSDHFGDNQISLPETVRRLVRDETGEWVTGPIDLLTHLRSYGHCFNPISFYFCWDSVNREEVKYVVTEVSNTPWNQVKCHVLPVESSSVLKTSMVKNLHVSPFSPMPDGYHKWNYRITLPTRDSFKIDASIVLEDSENNKLLQATLNLEEPKRTPFLYYLPRTTLVWLGIHWQAIICYTLGLKFYPNTTAAPNYDLPWLLLKVLLIIIALVFIIVSFF